MKKIGFTLSLIAVFGHVYSQGIPEIAKVKSHTKATLQFSESKSIQIEYMNIFGDFLFFSNAKVNRTPYHNQTIHFSGFFSDVKYSKESDSSGTMVIRQVPAGYKVYFLEYRLDSFYLDSLMPDSSGSIAMYFSACKQEKYTFVVDCLRPKHHLTNTFYFSYEGEDGMIHLTRDFALLSGDKSKTYHEPGKKHTSMDFLCFYGKSFRFVPYSQIKKKESHFR